MDISLQNLITQAAKTLESEVRAYRPLILDAFGKVNPDLKDDESPVTKYDIELEHKLRAALSSVDAGMPIVGEEGGGDDSASTFWLVDPIDGTEGFVRGLPVVRNMATLIYDNKPVFAFIYKPITDELITATMGQGAFKNGKKLQVSSRPLNLSWVDIVGSLSDPVMQRFISELNPKIKAFRILGDFTRLADGVIDASVSYKSGGGLWDYAPRGLLYQEAGAIVKNIGSDEYDFRNFSFIAANPMMFEELDSVINQVLEQF